MALLTERDYLLAFLAINIVLLWSTLKPFLAINIVLRWSTLKTFSAYKHRAPLEHSKNLFCL